MPPKIQECLSHIPEPDVTRAGRIGSVTLMPTDPDIEKSDHPSPMARDWNLRAWHHYRPAGLTARAAPVVDEVRRGILPSTSYCGPVGEGPPLAPHVHLTCAGLTVGGVAKFALFRPP